MRPLTLLAIAVAGTLLSCAFGQVGARQPDIGYVYPAGGQRGTSFQVLVGGQYLRPVKAGFVTGEGVEATFVEFVRPLSGNDLGNVGRHLRALTQKRVQEMAGAKPGAPAQPAKEEPLPELPDHPLLRGLESKTFAELADLRDMLFDPKKQRNAQIEESVILNVTIAPDAPPGERELRLSSPQGLTNPLVFQVGTLPEALEREPNGPDPVDAKTTARRPEYPVMGLPLLVNGQIMPGDVDRFRFRCSKGARLVIQSYARTLVPYLADAVPGWFQAVLSLRKAGGPELAFVDDYQFRPDPVMLFEVPEDGEYELEIRDSIYRGREDFVYRISIGETPFVMSSFPLGTQVGAQVSAQVTGWNLGQEQVPLDASPGGWAVRQAYLSEGGNVSNPIPYAVDVLPECLEQEPNDTPDQAQAVSLPQIINGRILAAGDADLFRFEGKQGDEVIADVVARKLGSPLDAVVRLTGPDGKVVAWNDDYMEKQGDLHTGPGLLTHHADSYLKAALPADGSYCVRIWDTQGQCGEAFAYRLRLSAPRPDFSLRVTPSSVTSLAGHAIPVSIHASRKDGFSGPIDLALAGAPPGFQLAGGRIPAGRDSIRVTLTCPRQEFPRPVPIRIEGTASLGSQTLTRPVVAAEDMMQAFLWRHLVPASQFVVGVMGAGRFAPTVTLADEPPVRVPVGGSVTIRLNAPGGGPLFNAVKLALSSPPKGMALQKVSVTPGGVELTVKLSTDGPAAGYADNLIVDAYTEFQPKGPDGKPAKSTQRVPLGCLPAIPFEVVQG